MKYPSPPPDVVNDLTGFVAGQVFTYCHRVVDGVCTLSTTYQMPFADTVWPTQQVAIAAAIGIGIFAATYALARVLNQQCERDMEDET